MMGKNPNRGYIRPSAKELPTDRDYRGTATVNGKEYWVSGYTETSKTKKGKTWINLVFQEKT